MPEGASASPQRGADEERIAALFARRGETRAAGDRYWRTPISQYTDLAFKKWFDPRHFALDELRAAATRCREMGLAHEAERFEAAQEWREGQYHRPALGDWAGWTDCEPEEW